MPGPALTPAPKRDIARITRGGVSAAALERALGLSAGYLSKVRHGAVSAGAQLEILLALLARHPLLLRELGVPARPAPRSPVAQGAGARSGARTGTRALALVGRVAPLLDAAGVHWAVGGAVALGLRGLPRPTADVDLFVRDDDRHALALFREAGASVGTMGPHSFVAYPKGAATAEDRVDIVFAQKEPLRSAVRRATRLPLGDVEVPVLRVVDLCAAKLLSHGPHDAVDACALIEAGLVEVRALQRALAAVPALPRGASAHARHHADTGEARARLRGLGARGRRKRGSA